MSPKTIQSMAVALSYLSEAKDKALLLETQCTLDIGLARFKVDLS